MTAIGRKVPKAEPGAAGSEPPSSRSGIPIDKPSDRETTPAASPEDEYVPSEAEADMAADILRYRQRVPPTRIKKSDQGKLELEVEHADDTVGTIALLAALGTRELAFLDGLVRQIGNAVSSSGDAASMEFMLAVVKGMEPKDQVEAMLAAQMAATHMAAMAMARRLAQVETILQQDSAERAFNKLARTFAAQTEALKRYRTGGEQKVTVQHVTVNEGGQAVVGSVTTGGRGAQKK